jgi:soluble lytic murein transglycosylase
VAIPRRLANILIPPRFCAARPTATGKAFRSHLRAASVVFGMAAAVATLASQAHAPSKRPKRNATASVAQAPAKPRATAGKSKIAQHPYSNVRERELEKLARALRDNPTGGSYAALSAFARSNARNELGSRAALALGYYDLSRGKADLALNWLHRAANETLLREYVLYWGSQAYLALGRQEEALAELENLRHDFPASVMNEQIVTSLAQTALALDRPEEADVVLAGYPNTASRPALLLLRAQAREKLAAATGRKPLAAAADYLDLYYRFPLNNEADIAGGKISPLKTALGEEFPGTPVQKQIARAELFYLARRWDDARSDYSKLIPMLSGADRQRAELRVAQCAVRSGGSPNLLTAVQLTDPELDAERLYTLSQAHRSQDLESQMLAEIEDLSKRFPQSSWLEDGLYAAGNYFWVNLDRDRASDFYRRTVGLFPDGKNASSASWRVAWTAYLQRQPDATDMLETFVKQFPSSDYVPDALYFLGRSYERSGREAHARSFYLAAASRFPLTYFGAKAADRIQPAPKGIGAGPVNPAEFLSVIPDPPQVGPLERPLSPKAEEHEARARLLSSIAFDASAELEYRAAYAESRSRRLLLNAASAAEAAGRYAAGIVAMRQVFPEIEARRIEDLPIEAWRAAFPLPYASSVRSLAVHHRLDPMLIAGLIRQESAFDSDALSRAGAVGLMQIMPSTGRRLARQLGVRYSRSRLTDPGYNLRLGSRYLANLIESFGTPEAALAAYNAGEDRVAQWTAGQNYLETAEFVESIPFTETRNYVKVVMRNADVYREVYGGTKAHHELPARTESTRPATAEQARPARAQKQRPARTQKQR